MMHALRGAAVREAGWIRGVVIVTAFLLILASGCCLFDDHGTTHHGIVQGPCVGLFAVLLVVASLEPLSASGWAVSRLVTVAYVVARHTPHPPPKLVLSF